MSVILVSPVDERDEPDHTVLFWREEQFGSLGFDRRIALRLAASDADLGLARRLYRDGCPSELAYRILF
jgi:hypothetical protein